MMGLCIGSGSCVGWNALSVDVPYFLLGSKSAAVATLRLCFKQCLGRLVRAFWSELRDSKGMWDASEAYLCSLECGRDL
jgi:hypothetical protein